MTKKHGPWTIKDTTQLYRDDFVEIYEDKVLKPDGEPSSYAVMRMKPGISVLAVDDGGTAYLTKQFRYAVGRESLEVVSGMIDEGERPLEAARRELREELGIEADEWVELGLIDAVTSQVFCPANIFLARRLKFGETDRDASEEMETVKMDFAEAVRAVTDGRITHGLSCVIILMAERHMRAE
ncbi:MAG TPA: NUDIX hydrolase [Pyrinomonadaceae bacterium]|nr:NUDIX hydrolase [Pyrinomonadaceae bacterium]